MHPRGKVCVVTGAASGIGEAVARAYVEAGARGVVIADLNAEKLATVAANIGALGVPTDVSKEADMLSGSETVMMTSVALDASAHRSGAADMICGANAFMMTSVADL